MNGHNFVRDKLQIESSYTKTSWFVQDVLVKSPANGRRRALERVSGVHADHVVVHPSGEVVKQRHVRLAILDYPSFQRSYCLSTTSIWVSLLTYTNELEQYS